MATVLNVTEILKRSDGTEIKISGDSKFYAQNNYANLILLDIEDGGSLEACALINFTQQTRQSFTSHNFFMKPVGIVTRVVNEEVITAYQYAIQVPKLVLQNNTKNVIETELTATISSGSNYKGYFSTLVSLNTSIPPTETLKNDLSIAYVVELEKFMQVDYNSLTMVYEWVEVDYVDMFLTQKQYSLSSIYIQPGYSSPQGIAPISVSNTQVIMNILNDLEVLYNSLNIDFTAHINNLNNPHEVKAVQVPFDNTGTQLVSTNTESAIKEVNTNERNTKSIVDGLEVEVADIKDNILEIESDVDGLEAEIGNIKNGTTIVKKAEQDASGNVITSTYETKADANLAKVRITLLENANMVKDVDYEPTTHVITFTFFDGTTQLLDLPLESTIVSASYDNITKDITFTLQNGETLVVPLDDLVEGLANETWVMENFIPKTALKSEFSTVPLNTNVPSEKLVKDELDKKELLENKATDFSTVNDTKYPTTKAVSERLLNLPIAELNNHSLREVFEGGQLLQNSDITSLDNWVNNNVTNLSYNTVTNYIYFEALGQYGGVYNDSYTSILNHKYYLIVEAMSWTSTGYAFLFNGDNTIYFNNPGVFETKTIITTAQYGVGNLFYADNKLENFSGQHLRMFKAYDLTSLDISSLTVSQMDYWFNVYQMLKNTNDANAIFSLFAPKQQEAWITPTLIGATSTYIRYRKDTLGTVIVEGNITVTTTGTNLTLPVGYRPLFAYTVGILTFNTNGTVVSSATGTQTLSVRYTGA